MRIPLLAGAAFVALEAPASAQQPPPHANSRDSQLDTLEPPGNAMVQTVPKVTGDPVLDRLNALEARVSQLQSENAQLRQQAELNEGRIETVETRSAKAVQFGWAPTSPTPRAISPSSRAG